MAKFKVLKEFVLNGITQKLDSIIELDKVRADLKSIQENIKKVSDNTPATGAETSVMDSLKPGEQMTPEQKAQLAKENLAATGEAQTQAADHRTRDVAEGKGEPVIKAVAGALKTKLENKEFQNTPPAPDAPIATPDAPPAAPASPEAPASTPAAPAAPVAPEAPVTPPAPAPTE